MLRDLLPGLVVDRYADTLVAQFGFAGVERWKAPIADALLCATGLQRLYERSDVGVRKLEGLAPATGWLQGESAWGRPADVLALPDGSLLVSDDLAGAIYRISYSQARRP